MTEQEAILMAQRDAAREPKTDPAPALESEHEQLMKALVHLTDAVLLLDRSIARLISAVNQCPVRPQLASLGGQ